MDIFLPVFPPLQVYSVVLLDTSVLSEGGGVFSGRFQTGGDGGRARGVWLDFQLSADKLHFTFQLLPVPLDSRQGRDQGPQGGREGSWVDGRRGLDGGGGHWTGGGMLLGGLALEISVVCFSSFQDGRGLELELELEFGFGLWGSGWVGVWGLGSQPATAGSLLVSHGQKKAALDSAWLSEHSTPITTQKNRNSEMRSAQVVAHIDCCLLTAALNIHIYLFNVDKVKCISQRIHFLCFLSAESLPDFHLIMSYSSLYLTFPQHRSGHGFSTG